MNKIRHNRLKPLWILSIALLLRVAIPVGYMPAAGGDLWFELCPEGVPAAFMHSLAGSSGHAGGHMNHGEAGHDDHQCPVGHMLLSAVALDDSWQVDSTPVPLALNTTHRGSFTNVFRTNYHSRGPPAGKATFK